MHSIILKSRPCVLRRAIARVKCHWGVLKPTRLAKLKSPAYAPAQHVLQTHILRNNMDISDMMSGDDVHESSFYESWIQLLQSACTELCPDS